MESVERRKRWTDRRTENDRRNEARLQWQADDCRSGTPRRVGDFSGELTEGTVWWQSNKELPKK